MKNKQKGFGVMVVLIIIALLGVAGELVYLAVKSREQVSLTSDITTPLPQNDNQTTSPDVPAPTSTNDVSTTVPPSTKDTVNADVEKVKVIMAEIGNAYLSQDNTKFLKYASVSTKDLFSSAKVLKVSNFTIGKVFKAGNVIVAEFTTTTENGAPQNQTMVFIKEGGDWKFDLEATVNYEKNKTAAAASDKNGYVDLVVTGIKIYPTHPIVNDPNVEIVVSIKNLGTKTSEKGAPASAELVEFTDAIPTQGGQLSPIVAKETVTWSYKPYGSNTFFNDSDTPGKKTLKITLNEYKDVTESNYANNIFTQTIEIFPN